MTLPNQIRNWLTIAFEQPVGSLMENFYFDRAKYQFFSIVVTDYFMLDEDMNKSDSVTTTYSKEQEDILVDRIQRIEYSYSEIIPVPRISLNERKDFMQEFVDSLTDSNLTDILNQRIANQDYQTKFDFYFGKEADDAIKQEWEILKHNFLQQKVDTFLNLNNINIDKATLWEVEAKGSISIDLTKDDKTETLPTTLDETEFKKIWWKFWQTKSR